MKKNRPSLNSQLQIRSDINTSNTKPLDLQMMTNLNIIYNRQIKADDK